MRAIWVLPVVLALVPACRDGFTVLLTCDADCSGHGECGLSPEGQLVCLCDPGYLADGLECIAEEAHPCLEIDCSGHGICGITSDGQVLCACDAGYHNQDPTTCLPDTAVCLSDGQCNDGNICTDDDCIDGACQNMDNTVACDDGLFCTATDSCAGGVCLGAGDPCPGAFCDESSDGCRDCQQDSHCDDLNACTADSCEAGNCTYTNNTAACDDGLFCTASDSCTGGVCLGSEDACPGELCDEANGTCAECLANVDCEDGQYCNGIDTCSGGGCVSSGDPCAGQACNETDDVCEAVLYWGTFTGIIARTALDSDATDILLGGVSVHDLRMVAANGTLYWPDRDANAIYFSPVDNPSAQVLINVGNPQGIAIDQAAQKIYYLTSSGNIYVADLDGSNSTPLYDSAGGGGLDLEEEAGKIYWATGTAVYRCSLDGSNPEPVVDIPGAEALGNIRIDDASQRAFVTDYNTGSVTSASLTGGPVTNIITGLINPSGLAIDHANGKLYVGTLHQILRVNLDGSGLEADIISHASVFQAWGLAIPH